MAAVKVAYGPRVTMDTPGLQGLAASATAGWQCDVVPNTTDLYLDVLVQVTLDFTNVAPAADKAATIFAYGGIGLLGLYYTSPATGIEGSSGAFIPNIDTYVKNLKVLGLVGYPVADAVVTSSPFSLAAALGGTVPEKWGLVIVNNSGAALAPSGNTVTWCGVTHAEV